MIGKITKYRCDKCKRSLIPKKEVKWWVCPCCGTLIRQHKDCGGRIRSYDNLILDAKLR